MTETTRITHDIAAKVLEVIDAGLVKGVGEPVLGQMCVEAAVCYAMGLPHGDQPSCVSPVLRELKIRLNDKDWSSNGSRAVGLRRLGLAQLGSAGVLDEKEFLASVVDMTIGKILPRAMRSAAKVNPGRAAELEAAAQRCEDNPTKDAAYAAAADAAARDTDVAADAADAAAYAADAAADGRAADAAAEAAEAAGSDADAAAAGDRELAFFAEEVVQILITMNAPGCQWLDLAPLSVQEHL